MQPERAACRKIPEASGANEMRATQLRPGMTIRHEGELYTVHSVEHRTPGNKRAAMATKMRNLRTGSIIDYRFRAEVDIERAIFDEIEHEILRTISTRRGRAR